MKSILGLAIGAILWLVCGLILVVIIQIVVGIASWNYETGRSVASAAVIPVILLSIVVGATRGYFAPRRREAAEVKKRKAHLNQLVSIAQKEFSGLTDLVPAAEQYLDLAEKEFEERAFAPFWDEIESATKNLATYQHGVRLIGNRAAEYQREADQVPGPSPPFTLPTSRLPDARGTADRLVQIVRKAQKDFQFATIYEQRKTNTILVEGFSTLGTAIYAVSDAISASLADLWASLQVSGDQLISQIAADADARREFEQDALEKLDDIQQGTKP